MRARASQTQESLESFIKALPRGVHLTAPEVFKLAKEQGLKISLSTVYRTLNNLSMQGQVQALAGEHGRRYEASDGEHDHDHLICLKCGLTIEFEDDLIKGFGRSVADRKGYEYKHSRFDVLGVCQQCRLKGEDHRIEAYRSVAEKALACCQEIVSEADLALAQLEMRKHARAKDHLETVLSILQEAFKELESGIYFEEESAGES